MSPRVRVHFTDRRKNTQFIEIPNQVPSPITGSNAGNFDLAALYHTDLAGLADSFINHKFLAIRRMIRSASSGADAVAIVMITNRLKRVVTPLANYSNIMSPEQRNSFEQIRQQPRTRSDPICKRRR